MKIIGHRGAAGLALENTIDSITAAKMQGVDAIEFDVRMTSDNHFILSHDASLRRVGGHPAKIRGVPLATLRQTRLKNGEQPPTLQEALAAAGDTCVFIEMKGSGWALQLAKLLQHANPTHTTVIARDADELSTFHLLLPKIPVYVVQRFNPMDVFQALHDANRFDFTGVDMNFWLLNPLTYWLARRHKLDIVVYTVNVLWIARFLLWMFPTISITTNHPHLMQSLRKQD